MRLPVAIGPSYLMRRQARDSLSLLRHGCNQHEALNVLLRALCFVGWDHRAGRCAGSGRRTRMVRRNHAVLSCCCGYCSCCCWLRKLLAAGCLLADSFTCVFAYSLALLCSALLTPAAARHTLQARTSTPSTRRAISRCWSPATRSTSSGSSTTPRRLLDSRPRSSAATAATSRL